MLIVSNFNTRINCIL